MGSTVAGSIKVGSNYVRRRFVIVRYSTGRRSDEFITDSVVIQPL